MMNSRLQQSERGKNRLRHVIIFKVSEAEHEDNSIRNFFRFFDLLRENKSYSDFSEKFGHSNITFLSINKDMDFKGSARISTIENNINKSNARTIIKEDWDLIKNAKVLTYYFRLEITSSNYESFDVDYIIPLLLLRQYLMKNGHISIENSNDFLVKLSGTFENYFRVSHCMLIESLLGQRVWCLSDQKPEFGKLKLETEFEPEDNSFYDQFYYWVNASLRPQRLAINSIGLFGDYLPVIRLNEYSYSILSKNVQEYYESFVDIGSTNDNIIDELDKLIRKKGDPKKILLDIQRQEEFQFKLIESLIIRTCRSLIKESKILIKFREEKIFAYCRHMSILSFMFFLSFCKDSEPLIKEEQLTFTINTVQDYADGIIQLIENAVEYADEIAYLRFKIKTFVETSGKSKSKQRLLEVVVIDFNDSSIVETFLRNIKSGLSPDDHKLLDNFILQDFFQPSKEAQDFWNKYYENIENLTFHFGLRQFLSSVEVGKGFFRLVSSSRLDPGPDEIYEKSFLEDRSVKPEQSSKHHIPGTTYIIRLPINIAEKLPLQIPVGMGVEFNYDDKIIDLQVNNISLFKLANSFGILEGPFSQNIREIKISEMLKGIIESKENFISNQTGKRRLCTLCFDARDFKHSLDKQYFIEIFSKTIIQYINLTNEATTNRIAIINASRTFIINFTRIYATFCYNIDEINIIQNRLKNTQIYLCDEKLDLELIFYGGALSAAYKCVEYMATRKGVYPESENIIHEVLLRKNNNGEKYIRTKKFKIAPFEICITQCENNPITLFEKRTSIELNRDIQTIPFGCTLNNSHMRVGSKIHVKDKFFDATSLMGSSYYTQRFSFLIAKKIKKISKNKTNRIMLIGYEDYSEALIIETQKLLIKNFGFTDIKYLIYSTNKRSNFKYDDQTQVNDEIFIIVPVNSTLTTHVKISDALYRNLSMKNIDVNNLKIFNLAVILIRDSNGNILDEKLSSLEKNYWQSIDLERRLVKTKFLENAYKYSNLDDSNAEHNEKVVHYNILLESDWEDPLTCEGCFPKNLFRDEMPMLEIDKTSVRLKVKSGLTEYLPAGSITVNDKPGDIRDLQTGLIYNHTQHSGNHFQYFFQTEKIQQFLQKNKPNEFAKWKNRLKKVIEDQREELERKNFVVYDILVAPITSSNAIFVQEINTSVFNTATIIVNINPFLDFRENVTARFSNLTSLYWNNYFAGKKAHINFHFVDDAIASGTTITKAQSLIKSLFPREAFYSDNSMDDKEASVKVNVFKNVIILINRCSIDEMNDYVQAGFFHCYYDLHISPLSIEKASECLLCNLKNQYKTIVSCSSTNEMTNWWERKITKIQVRSIDEVFAIYSEEDDLINERERIFPSKETRDKRYARRMICSHRFSKKLNGLSSQERNNTASVRSIILELVNDELKNSNNYIEFLEVFLSYIKVISRPFPVYRKSTMTAIFKLLIEFTEIVLSVFWEVDDKFICPEDLQNIYELFQDIKAICPILKINEQIDIESVIYGKRELLGVLQSLWLSLLSQLSSLGSKYLIRKESIENIRKSPSKLGIDKEDFELFYLAIIKRVITVNRDETIGLWLEYLLWTGKEYGSACDKFTEYDPLIKFHADTRNYTNPDFYQMLFFENTHITFDAIEEIISKKEFLIPDSDLKDNEIKKWILKYLPDYYFDNFGRMRYIYSLSINDKDFNLDKAIRSTYSNWKNDDKLISSIISLVRLIKLLNNEEEKELDIVQYFNNLSESIKSLTGCQSVSMYGYSGYMVDDKPYFLGSTYELDKKYYHHFNVDYENNENRQTIFAKDNFSLIRIIDSNRSRQKNSLLIILQWKHNESESQRFLGVRDIITFRNIIEKKILGHFNDDSFYKFRKTQILNDIITEVKAVTHTPEDKRAEICDEIFCLINSEKFGSNIERFRYIPEVLELTSDSVINELFFQFIMKDEKNSNNRFEKSFSNPVVFSKNLIAILESISFKKDTGNCVSVKLIIDEEIDEIIKYKFITDDRHEHYPFLFIIALLQNAVKHGIESDQNKDKVDVFLSVNKEYLEFKNLTYPQNMDDAIRSANQTTLKAITYYFDIVAENSNTRTFVYETSDHKQSSDKKWFIAKLPRI